MKKLEFNTKDCETLVELLFRGLAYTDGFYSTNCYPKVKRIFEKTIKQFEKQGGKYTINGIIKFENEIH